MIGAASFWGQSPRRTVKCPFYRPTTRATSLAARATSGGQESPKDRMVRSTSSIHRSLCINPKSGCDVDVEHQSHGHGHYCTLTWREQLSDEPLGKLDRPPGTMLVLKDGPVVPVNVI